MNAADKAVDAIISAAQALSNKAPEAFAVAVRAKVVEGWSSVMILTIAVVAGYFLSKKIVAYCNTVDETPMGYLFASLVLIPVAIVTLIHGYFAFNILLAPEYYAALDLMARMPGGCK